MATYDEVIQALRAADAAGNTADATALAQLAASMKETPVKKSEGMLDFLPKGVPNWMQSRPGQGWDDANAQAAGGDVTNPMAYLSEAQKTEQGSTEKAIGRGVNRAVQVGAGLSKGAVINPAAAVLQLIPTDATRQYAADANTAYQAQRKAAGAEGYDWAELAGAIASPINKLMPAVAADTLIGRTALAGVGGAISAGFTPVDDITNFAEAKMKQIGTGFALGAILNSGVELGKGASKLIKDFAQPLTESGRTEALRKYFNELTGEARDKIVAALNNASEIVKGSKPTAAEAIAGIPEATSLAAYQAQLSKQPQGNIAASFATREAQQEAARQAALRSVGGTEADLAAAYAAREAATSPLRENALKQSNIAGVQVPKLEEEIAARFASKVNALKTQGTLQTEAAQANERALGWTPVPGYPKFPARYNENMETILGNIEGSKVAKDVVKQRQAEAEFKQFQLDSLAQNGFYPLRSNTIIDKIDNILKKPGEMASDVTVNTLSSLRDKLTKLTDPKTGVIDSANLYTIRKEIGDDIKKFSMASQSSDVRNLSRLEGNIKSYIDNAIEGAGGTDWKKYLSTYQQASEKINRMQVGQLLEDKLGTSLGDKERAGVFANAVDNAYQTIKSSSGQTRYTKLEDILTPSEVSTVNKVLADVQRQAKADTLASKSLVQNANEAGGITLPSLLSRPAQLLNYVMKKVKSDANDEINILASQMMLDPKQLDTFISSIPKENTPTVVKAFMSKMSPELRDAFGNQLSTRGLIAIAKPGREQ
jgi:hypothetical protein